MRRLVTLAVLGVLGAALVVSMALAQNAAIGKQGSKDYNGQFTKIGGSETPSIPGSNSNMTRVSDDGSLWTRSADNPESRDQRTTIVSTVLGANGGNITSIVPVPIKGAKFVTVQLLMTPGSAAADTDSVNVEVFAFTKQTDQPTDGINLAFDFDQTDAALTPLYFTRNQNQVGPGTGWGRRVFCGRQTSQPASGSFNTAATAAIVDAGGAPLAGEYIAVRIINRSPTKPVSLEALLYIHYE